MLKVRIAKDGRGQLAFYVFGVGHTINEQLIFGPTTRKVLREGELVQEPSLVIWDHPEQFMLALKEAIREYEGSTPDFAQGELRATKYHLEDLRKFIFERMIDYKFVGGCGAPEKR